MTITTTTETQTIVHLELTIKEATVLKLLANESAYVPSAYLKKHDELERADRVRQFQDDLWHTLEKEGIASL